jgi:Fic family protein
VNPYLVASPLLHREAILSSRIEGTISTPEQLVLFEAGVAAASDREREDTLEVRNYVQAMEHGLASPLPLSLRLLRELHRVLMTDVRGNSSSPGEFRRVQNFIGRPGDTVASARFVPPPVSEMHACLDELERRLHREDEGLPLLVKVALVHYQFEAIHPFLDGNGRVGRLFIALMLVRAERLQAPVLYLSAYLERNRDRYIDLLLDTSRTGAWLAWVRFFLQGVVESAVETLKHAEALLALRQRYHDQLRGARSFGHLERLVDHLFTRPSTTIGLAAEYLGVTQAAASGHIRKLVDAGILKEWTGRRRDQVFVAPGILTFMRDRPEVDS